MYRLASAAKKMKNACDALSDVDVKRQMYTSLLTSTTR